LALNVTSGGNNFNDFPENQLTIDFAFLCKPAWWNATVSPFPLFLIAYHSGEWHFPKKYLGKRRSPHSRSTTSLYMNVNAYVSHAGNWQQQELVESEESRRKHWIRTTPNPFTVSRRSV